VGFEKDVHTRFTLVRATKDYPSALRGCIVDGWICEFEGGRYHVGIKDTLEIAHHHFLVCVTICEVSERLEIVAFLYPAPNESLAAAP